MVRRGIQLIVSLLHSDVILRAVLEKPGFDRSAFGYQTSKNGQFLKSALKADFIPCVVGGEQPEKFDELAHVFCIKDQPSLRLSVPGNLTPDDRWHRAACCGRSWR